MIVCSFGMMFIIMYYIFEYKTNEILQNKSLTYTRFQNYLEFIMFPSMNVHFVILTENENWLEIQIK